MKSTAPTTTRTRHPPWKKGESGNPKGRPKLGDSLAQAIRDHWPQEQRIRAILAIARRAARGDLPAFETLARRGWPEEAHGEVSGVQPATLVQILHQHLHVDGTLVAGSGEPTALPVATVSPESHDL